MSENNSTYVVAVGSSAGGLEALLAMLGKVDASMPACYIIAQHLDPNHPSLLKELLSRGCDLDVEIIEDGLPLEKSKVYVTPPGSHIEVVNNKLKTSPIKEIGPRPSVNMLFSSVAKQFGEKAVAVVLSGTGTDGAMGIRDIKAHGGFVITQDQDAKYDGMPRAALESGLVDIRCSASEVATELKKLFQMPEQLGEVAIDKSTIRTSLDKVFRIVYDRTGTDFSGYKLKTIQRRIQRRMALHQNGTIAEYVDTLLKIPGEAHLLHKEILISVTNFFRDDNPFEMLAAEIEKLIEEKKNNSAIRVWVPGCATGEEAYSIAIICDELIKRSGKTISLQVFATDLDDDALSFARKGLYSPSNVEGVPEDILKDYFVCRDNYYHVIKDIRERIVFARQNLVGDPPFSRVDILSCRNLLIYFGPQLQKHAASVFQYSVTPGGLLFLGKSESLGNHIDLFDVIDTKSQLFRRRPGAVTEPLNYSPMILGPKSSTANNVIKPSSKPKVMSLSSRVEQNAVSVAIPPAVVVDIKGRVLHLRGNLSNFLDFPEGNLDLDILTLARQELKFDIRMHLKQLRESGQCVTEATTFNAQSPGRILQIQGVTLQEGEKEEPLYILYFRHVETAHVNLEDKGEGTDPVYLRELKQELSATREHLQISVQELETTNEELQSTNEELQSSNEELQSANEELQTANEELQSTNEELNTVNEELEVKSSELAGVNTDLENVLQNIGVPAIVLDRRLRLTRYTHQAAKLLNIAREDVNQAITALGYNIPVQGLRHELMAVIDSESEKHFAVVQDGSNYVLKLIPHISEERFVVGVILIFEKSVDDAAKSSGEVQLLSVFKSLTEDVSGPVVLLNHSGVILSSNDEAQKMLGSVGNTDGRTLVSFKSDEIVDTSEGFTESALQDLWCSIVRELRSDAEPKTKVIELAGSAHIIGYG